MFFFNKFWEGLCHVSVVSRSRLGGASLIFEWCFDHVFVVCWLFFVVFLLCFGGVSFCGFAHVLLASRLWFACASLSVLVRV